MTTQERGDEGKKPFGTIRYYRYPHSMERNIEDAVKLYSGDKPKGLFVDKLESNLNKINASYDEIAALFANAGVADFEKLPADASVCGQFAKLFTRLNEYLEAAKIQGFVWSKDDALSFDKTIYLTLVLRYKALSRGGDSDGGGGGCGGGGGGGGDDDVPFDISGHLTEIDTGKIDADYMNLCFEKYFSTQQEGADSATIQKTVNELHKSFATLTREEQKMAHLFLNDVQRGDVTPEAGKTFRQYISEYQASAKNAQITELVKVLGKNIKAEQLFWNVNLNQTATWHSKRKVSGVRLYIAARRTIKGFLIVVATQKPKHTLKV